MSQRGKFILLEGGEGVGKSTQAKLLIEDLTKRGVTATLVREPGGDPVAEAIRTLILADDHHGMEVLTELFLFCAARSQVMATKVRPILERGDWVIADRGALSSLVYQGYVKGADLESIRTLCQIAMGDCRPDLTLVLHAPAEQALQRRADGGGSNRFEAEGLAFHQQINDHYVAEAKRQGYPVIDATADVESVRKSIQTEVEPIISTGT